MAKHNKPYIHYTRKDLTADYVRSVLDYNKITGLMYWKWRPDASNQINSTYAGTLAGSTNTSGHRQIHIKNGTYLRSRLAYLIVTGKWPDDLLDHKNCDPSDDRWKNIRPATKSQNGKNRKINKNNRSGYKGVKCRNTGTFQAAIQVNGTQIHLGTYKTAALAHAAYKKAAIMLHKKFCRIK